jgi:GNAT superfamily N-acetyltransferase
MATVLKTVMGASPSRVQIPAPPPDHLVPGFVKRSCSIPNTNFPKGQRIRPCRDDERSAILEIVNAAAAAYRGVIPADRWHEPYMSSSELDGEFDAGLAFWGCDADGALVGVMGMQRVRDVDLIRHAYVLPSSQRQGVGGALLEHLRRLSDHRMLVGTWAAADWAISFYRHHGFESVSPDRMTTLLKTYWSVPDRQIETSVVLANPPLDEPSEDREKHGD